MTIARRCLGIAAGISLCAVVAAVVTLHGLGRRPLLDAEARYALVAQEMLVSGDWIQPRLDTLPYYEKPPLFYWAIALSYRGFNVNEFAARLPSALAHVATTLVVFALARALLGLDAATFAGLVYAGAVGPVTYARYSFPDGLLVLCLSVSLLGLTQASRGLGGWTLFYLGAAAAGLTKGFLGLVIPLGAIVVYVMVSRDIAIIARLRPVWGAVIVLGLFLPWHVALALRDPAFTHFYVVNEHIYRFLNMREPVDYVPLSLPAFWSASLFWFLPWSLVLPGALLWCRKTPARPTLALIWAALVIGFFSLARSRLERYGLPAIPALAVVIAAYWHALAEDPRPRAALIAPALLIVAFGVAILPITFLSAAPVVFDRVVATLDGHYREHPEQGRLIMEEAVRLARPFSILLLAFGLCTWAAARAGRGRLTFWLWIVFLLPALMLVDRATEPLGATRSQRDAAAIITRHWQDDAQVVVQGLYDDAMSVTFYTRRPTYIVDRDSTDLAFGFRQVPDSPLSLTSVQLEELWRSPRPIFLLTSHRPLPRDAYLLLDGPTYALVTNHRPPSAAGGS